MSTHHIHVGRENYMAVPSNYSSAQSSPGLSIPSSVSSPSLSEKREEEYATIHVTQSHGGLSNPSSDLGRRRRRRYHWTWETLCLLASGLAIAGTIVVCKIFDGKPIPTWSYRAGGISINTVLSLLSTMSRASLLIPLDEAMGQLMWLGFTEGEKRLVEAELYNQAARGPTGAIKLLWRRRGRGLASLGCLVMIIALGLGIAQQQLLAYPTKLFTTVDNSTQVASAKGYSNWAATSTNPTNPDPAPAAEFPIAAALFASLSSSQHSTPAFTCNAGNCQYPQFETLALCASCEDLTHELQSDCTGKNPKNCTATFRGLSADMGITQTGSLSTNLNQTTAHNNATASSLLEITSLRSNLSSWPPVLSASSCALSWCVKTLNASVTNNTYNEQILHEDTTASVTSDGDIFLPSTNGSSNDNFTVTAKSHTAMLTLAPLLTGWSRLLTNAPGSGGKDTWIFSSPLFGGLATFPVQNITNTTSPTASPASAFAKSITDSIRSTPDITGSIVTPKTIVVVRWPWLIYSGVEWVLSAVFLAVIVIKARSNEGKVGAWGSSNIALMVWGNVSEGVKEAVGDWSGKTMKEKAAKVKVRLVEHGAEGWRLEGGIRGKGDLN